MGAPTMSTAYMQRNLPNVSQFIGNLPDVGSSGDVLSSLAPGGDINWMNPDFAAENERMTQSVFQRGMNMLEPRMQQQEEAAMADLAARGIPVGSEAFNDRTGNIARQQADQLENLALSSIGSGSQEAGRLFGQAATRFGLAEGQNMQDFTQGMGALTFDEQQRQNRMNEQMRALQGALAKQSTISGIENQRAALGQNLGRAAVDDVGFVKPPGVDAMGAMQNAYNANQAQYQGNIGALTNLGTMALTGGMGGGGSMFNAAAAANGLPWSDVRLKENITYEHDIEGVPVYTFSYKGHPEVYRGTMAQDVMETHPEAVRDIGGFYAVDYNKLPIDMEIVTHG